MKPATRSFYADAVQAAVDRIAGCLDDAMELTDLSRAAGLSPFHFHRIFRGMAGETPLEMLRRLRIERAAWQISHTTRPITEIAFDAGYETHEAFTRAFRVSYHASPTAYRARRRTRFELSATCGIHFEPDGKAVVFTPRDSGGRDMDVEIVEMPPMRVGAVRHVGPHNQVHFAFDTLGRVAGKAGLFQRPGAVCLAIYYGDPDTTPADQLYSDAAVSVDEETPLPSELTEQRVRGGRFARTTYVGPYERLGDAWGRFMGEWLPASGYRVGPGGTYEIYRNDPSNTPKDQLRTDLYISIDEA